MALHSVYVAKGCIQLASTFISAAEEVQHVLNQRLHFGVENLFDPHTVNRLNVQRERALFIVAELMSIAQANAYAGAVSDSQATDSGESPECAKS